MLVALHETAWSAVSNSSKESGTIPKPNPQVPTLHLVVETWKEALVMCAGLKPAKPCRTCSAIAADP